VNDLLIGGARLIDGTGAPARMADVWIRDGLIHAVMAAGQPPGEFFGRRVEAPGLVLAPGFIDMHTHDDALMLQCASVSTPHAKLSQGVTTVVTGNCGISLAPLVASQVPPPLDILGQNSFRFASFADYLDTLATVGPVCNVATLLGHTTLRIKHVADCAREANGAEQAQMANELVEALNAGAWGLSTGVYYPPARAATAQELITVGAALRESGANLAMHLRCEGDAIDSSLREAFSVATALDCRLVLSHHKLLGKANHGRSAQTLQMIDQASAALDVCLDCYPYNASSTMLLPERIADCSDVLITWSQADPSAAGQMLSALAKARNTDAKSLAHALLPAGAIYFGLDEADVRRILQHPKTAIGSDGLAHDRFPHPRLWGSFTRVLGHYTRELGLLSWEGAIHKMTGLPAARWGLDIQRGRQPPRGQIAPGFAADLVLMDPNLIQDRATFSHPTLPSVGIEQVYLNGELAAVAGVTVSAHAGQVLRRNA
jgi:N-acyl-D-amino-acid deacylase